jgi:hypothetical protein
VGHPYDVLGRINLLEIQTLFIPDKGASAIRFKSITLVQVILNTTNLISTFGKKALGEHRVKEIWSNLKLST